MNECVLIKCEICNELFNPGILEDAYPAGFIPICNKCFNGLIINEFIN